MANGHALAPPTDAAGFAGLTKSLASAARPLCLVFAAGGGAPAGPDEAADAPGAALRTANLAHLLGQQPRPHVGRRAVRIPRRAAANSHDARSRTFGRISTVSAQNCTRIHLSATA